MRQWRVGSFSMGSTLALFGVALLMGQVDAGRQVLPFVSRWWAIIPILLGLEILAAGFFSREANPPIKYDFFGILVAFFVVSVSIGLHGLSEGGVLPSIQRAFGSMEYSVEMGGDSIGLDDSIRRIVVTSDSAEIDVRSSPEPQVTFFGSGRMSAVSQEEASAMAAQAGPARRTEGDTLFLSFGLPPEPGAFGGHPSQLRWTVLVPTDRDLELSGRARINVVVAGLAADWTVKSSGTVSVRLGSQENLRLQARVVSPGRLSSAGIPWKDDAVPATAGDGKEVAAQGPITKVAVLGQGRYSLRVNCPGSVDIEM